jgi:soluble lytic murein transglycosylase
MSAQAPARSRTRAQARPRRRTKAQRRRIRRRRLIILATTVIAAVAAVAILEPFADKAVQEIALPLRHEDIIRQQAADKDLDPTLIAGVIYMESRFVDQTSEAGAKGLMQILPSTADYIAQKSGGTQFQQGDLASPQINIAYGSWYLRYLLRKYDEHEVLALAAYNAGEGKVDEWYRSASERGEDFDVAAHVPFPETRNYVIGVLDARERYKRRYRQELGV